MKWITALLTISTSILWIAFSPSITLPEEKPPTIEVYFSPHGGCTDAIIMELNQARSTVLVQAYTFTSAAIAKALLNFPLTTQNIVLNVGQNRAELTHKLPRSRLADFYVFEAGDLKCL